MSRYNSRPPRPIRLHHGDIIEEALAILRRVADTNNDFTVDEIEVYANVANGFVKVAEEVRMWVSRDRVRPADDREPFDEPEDDEPLEEAV